MKVMRQLPLFRRLTLTLVSCSAVAVAQYKAEPAGAPPSDLAPAIAKALRTDGTKVTNNGKPYLEIWFRADKPSGPKSAEDAVTLPNIPQGALLAVIRLDGKGSDRRGQAIKPGVYTLRYSLMPVNGDHQGAAPQRDFVLMVPAADDKDPSATPGFEALVEMSRKASGTGHPAVMSLWKADDAKTGLTQQGDDWVIQTKIGDTPIALIVIGTAAA
jgi:hypothetical protein